MKKSIKSNEITRKKCIQPSVPEKGKKQKTCKTSSDEPGFIKKQEDWCPGIKRYLMPILFKQWMILRNEDILLASTEFLQAADISVDLGNAKMAVLLNPILQ